MSVQIVKLLDSMVQLNINVKPRGVYNSSTVYSIGDSVSYTDGSSYICINSSIGNSPLDTSYWQVLALVGATGPTGSTGATGASGGDYQHIQSTASDTWTINHNLGFYPAIICRSVGGLVFESSLQHISVNQAIVTLSMSFAGYATCS